MPRECGGDCPELVVVVEKLNLRVHATRKVFVVLGSALSVHSKIVLCCLALLCCVIAPSLTQQAGHGGGPARASRGANGRVLGKAGTRLC